MPKQLTPEIDKLAIAVIRGIAMDAPLLAKSGHQGTAMSLAPLAHVLYSRIMNHAPQDPTWCNRDRFILSNGHASILQYSLLFLSGYGLTRNDLSQFRQWGSATPGHPEVGHTAGVEVTTGPLGQGFANAVGMAIAESHLAATLGSEVMSHKTFVLVGDGCLMEGISHEAASLAGHLKLENLVCIFDDNKITIDGSTSLSCSDDVAMRFRSYGWNVLEPGNIAEDCDAIEKILRSAIDNTGSPTIIVFPTTIGFPSPDWADKHEAHGNPFTASHVTATKKILDIPDELFFTPEVLVEQYRTHCAHRGSAALSEWNNRLTVEQHSAVLSTFLPIDRDKVNASLPLFDSDTVLATRQAFQKIIEATCDVIPQIMTGAADLTGNTGAKISSAVAYSALHREGQQIFYGIREHAMGSTMVGMALHGGVLPVGGTFFVFVDYMRPAVRLAALSRARVVFVFSHDSVGVGEDGPTHQPIEQLATLRAIPGLQVIRPADANETAQAWLAAVTHDGPTAIILSRQNVVHLTDGSAVVMGAGKIRYHPRARANIIGTGSELSIACGAAELLASKGIQTNVVSMPSWDRFESLSPQQRDEILSPTIPSISVEAGSTFGWAKYAKHSVGIDRFGASAPGSVVLEKLGITPENVAAVVTRALS